ncbi:hypothetical protein [Streptomyces sp. NPDC002067]
MAMLKSTMKQQVAEAVARAAPGDRALVTFQALTGPVPWLTGGLLGHLVATYYFVTLTDRAVVLHHQEVSQRPTDIAYAIPREQAHALVTEARLRPLWSVVRLALPGAPAPVRLNVHRMWRAELEQFLPHAGGPGGAPQGYAPGPAGPLQAPPPGPQGQPGPVPQPGAYGYPQGQGAPQGQQPPAPYGIPQGQPGQQPPAPPSGPYGYPQGQPGARHPGAPQAPGQAGGQPQPGPNGASPQVPGQADGQPQPGPYGASPQQPGPYGAPPQGNPYGG